MCNLCWLLLLWGNCIRSKELAEAKWEAVFQRALFSTTLLHMKESSSNYTTSFIRLVLHKEARLVCLSKVQGTCTQIILKHAVAKSPFKSSFMTGSLSGQSWSTRHFPNEFSCSSHTTVSVGEGTGSLGHFMVGSQHANLLYWGSSFNDLSCSLMNLRWIITPNSRVDFKLQCS